MCEKGRTDADARHTGPRALADLVARAWRDGPTQPCSARQAVPNGGVWVDRHLSRVPVTPDQFITVTLFEGSAQPVEIIRQPHQTNQETLDFARSGAVVDRRQHILGGTAQLKQPIS